ncbi:hypothetical protein ACTFIY_003912 [Dictyostelium cf. discoideum]
MNLMKDYFGKLLKNKCCHKSKKFKIITTIDSMLKHKQYQLLICKLNANENLYFKSTYRIIEKIYEIEDIELFKEINSLLLSKGYQEVKILFDGHWDLKSADLFDLHLKHHPEQLQTYITTSIDSIFLYNHPKLIITVLNFLELYINDNEVFTLTKNDRNYFIGEYSEIGKHRQQEIIEWIEMISNIPISPKSILGTQEYKVFRGVDKMFKGNFDLSNKSNDLSLLSNFCIGFEKYIEENIEYAKGESGYISSSIDSVLLYFEFYYCNYFNNYKSNSIPTSIQTQIDLIIENNNPHQSIKQLFSYWSTYNTNVLIFLLKKNLKIKFALNDICEPYVNILFKDNQIDKNNIIIFYNTYLSQTSIILEDIDKKPLDDLISTKELIDYGDNQFHSIFDNESFKWKEITSNLFDNDMIVTLKDKETIDWLSDIETGCSFIKIRDALNSKLKQMKLDFSTSSSNKKLRNIHILRTHDDIESLINRFNQLKFIDNEDLFKYYMIQLIQFGSRNSIKYLGSICDYIHGDFNKYKIPTQQTCQIINLTKIKVNVNHFPNATSYLLQTFIQLFNFDGARFILDNSNGKKLFFNEKPIKDHFHNRIYISKYSYKDFKYFIQYLIDKFNEVKNLTIDQIKTTYQLISDYIEINRSKHTSYYYLKTLSPIITSCITVIEDPTNEDPSKYISVYTFEYIFSNRTNHDLSQFIDSTIMDIINLFQQHEFNIKRKKHNVVNSEQEDSRDCEQIDASDDCEHENLTVKVLYRNGEKPLLSSNMVEWLGEIINKDYSDYQDIINYLFKKYGHQLGPYNI